MVRMFVLDSLAGAHCEQVSEIVLARKQKEREAEVLMDHSTPLEISRRRAARTRRFMELYEEFLESPRSRLGSGIRDLFKEGLRPW